MSWNWFISPILLIIIQFASNLQASTSEVSPISGTLSQFEFWPDSTENTSDDNYRRKLANSTKNGGFPAKPKKNSWWVDLHKKYSDEASSSSFVDVLFVGDSLIEGWGETFDNHKKLLYNGVAQVWQNFSSHLNGTALKFGIAGDKVQHLRWRLQNGELPETLHVSVLAISIGVNDLLSDKNPSTPEETVRQIFGLVDYIRQTHPETVVLILGVIPTSYPTGTNITHTAPALVNALLATRNGSDDGTVEFMDCSSSFLTPNKTLNTTLYIGDRFMYLHLSKYGYKVWADCLQPGVNRALAFSETIVLPPAESPQISPAPEMPPPNSTASPTSPDEPSLGPTSSPPDAPSPDASPTEPSPPPPPTPAGPTGPTLPPPDAPATLSPPPPPLPPLPPPPAAPAPSASPAAASPSPAPPPPLLPLLPPPPPPTTAAPAPQAASPASLPPPEAATGLPPPPDNTSPLPPAAAPLLSPPAVVEVSPPPPLTSPPASSVPLSPPPLLSTPPPSPPTPLPSPTPRSSPSASSPPPPPPLLTSGGGGLLSLSPPPPSELETAPTAPAPSPSGAVRMTALWWSRVGVIVATVVVLCTMECNCLLPVWM